MSPRAKFISHNLLSEKNIAKYVLPKYNLFNCDIEQIKIKNTEKHRAVYKIHSKLGENFCLKKVYYNEEHLLFIYSAVEWLSRNNISVPKFLPTADNNRFINFKEMLFIMTPWVEGQKCSYDNLSDVINSSKNLATIHKISEKFKPIPGSTIKKGYDNIYISTSKHFNRLLTYSNLAFNYNDTFSKIYLNSFEINSSLAQFSVEMASSISFNKLSSSLCHGDYVNKNIITDTHNNIWVIDFDKCCLDYSCHDISYYLRRLLKRSNTEWNVQIALKCLKRYYEINPLSSEDFKYILVYLAFPQKYWRLSRDYFNNIETCNKATFCDLLLKTTSKREAQIKFIDKLYTDLRKEFNINI